MASCSMSSTRSDDGGVVIFLSSSKNAMASSSSSSWDLKGPLTVGLRTSVTLLEAGDSSPVGPPAASLIADGIGRAGGGGGGGDGGWAEVDSAST